MQARFPCSGEIFHQNLSKLNNKAFLKEHFHKHATVPNEAFEFLLDIRFPFQHGAIENNLNYSFCCSAILLKIFYSEIHI